MKCFISREYNESPELISSIQEVLDELNIQYFDMFSMQSGLDMQATLCDAIKEAQIVIAVLTQNVSNVLFELGLAVGSGKVVFLLIDNPEHIPFDLLGMTYIKINENLKENLALPLRFLMDKKRKRPYVDYAKYYLQGIKYAENVISEKEYLEKLEQIRKHGNSLQFEKLVEELFEEIKEQYTTINFRNELNDSGYDFAVWIDELAGNVMNPILFELKMGDISEEQLNKSVYGMATRVKNQELALILYCNRNMKEIKYQSNFPNILVVKFETFLSQLCEHGLARTVWYFRNLGAHGRSY
ncbi:MAG: TIR domain-containing protein [Turicibacter sp.]|nr:TIR domain-containing protein [Turicibacter sp.]